MNRSHDLRLSYQDLQSLNYHITLEIMIIIYKYLIGTILRRNRTGLHGILESKSFVNFCNNLDLL